MKDGARRAVRIAGIAVLTAGVCGMLYPFIGRWINRGRYEQAAEDYVLEAGGLPDRAGMLADAEAYNAALPEGRILQAAGDGYEDLLSVSGVMAYVEIPAIDVKLPVRHGTSEEVLQAGAGHLQGSSLPVGGAGTHAVITAHSGLPSNRMFTDLDQLRDGDRIVIRVLDRVLEYETDGMQVVLPDEADLEISPDADELTLVTCTPVGANTHRLLVHAVRVPDAAVSAVPEEPARQSSAVPAAMIVIILMLFAVLVFWLARRRNRKEAGR